jgi:hypothetical protein
MSSASVCCAFGIGVKRSRKNRVIERALALRSEQSFRTTDGLRGNANAIDPQHWLGCRAVLEVTGGSLRFRVVFWQFVAEKDVEYREQVSGLRRS